jgi:hypothetical protein
MMRLNDKSYLIVIDIVMSKLARMTNQGHEVSDDTSTTPSKSRLSRPEIAMHDGVLLHLLVPLYWSNLASHLYIVYVFGCPP